MYFHTVYSINKCISRFKQHNFLSPCLEHGMAVRKRMWFGNNFRWHGSRWWRLRWSTWRLRQGGNLSSRWSRLTWHASDWLRRSSWSPPGRSRLCTVGDVEGGTRGRDGTSNQGHRQAAGGHLMSTVSLSLSLSLTGISFQRWLNLYQCAFNLNLF